MTEDGTEKAQREGRAGAVGGMMEEWKRRMVMTVVIVTRDGDGRAAYGRKRDAMKVMVSADGGGDGWLMVMVKKKCWKKKVQGL